MKIESQVCSLELSKRLKELGVKQKSFFSWYAFENPLYNIFQESDVDEDRWIIGPSRDGIKCGVDWIYSAYTVAELGELFPPTLYSNYYLICIKLEENRWKINYHHDDNNFPISFMNIESYTAADVHAKMLIYLIENNLVSVEEINQRIAA